jgi:hypothetical protein
MFIIAPVPEQSSPCQQAGSVVWPCCTASLALLLLLLSVLQGRNASSQAVHRAGTVCSLDAAWHTPADSRQAVTTVQLYPLLLLLRACVPVRVGMM